MTEHTSIVLVLILTKGHELVDTAKCTRILHKERCVIGRGSRADWILPDPANQISRRHCSIEWTDGLYRLTDTSSNGTFVNDWDEPIPNGEACNLQDGDIIKVGTYYISTQILPEDADSRLNAGDFFKDPERQETLADLLPKTDEGSIDEWIEDEVVSSEDELADALEDPLESPETILRRTTETLDPYSTGEGKPEFPAGNYGTEGNSLANSVPFDSDCGISSEEGASAWDHNSTESDAFKLPRAQHQTIPEDWDSDPSNGAESKTRKPNDD
ncbi:FHA domain protein [Pseudovibrio axinellae]|uniref:FHA domain protein n=1 Tax=Pseudovibrio axinellae TaxID=989403 RepID=A0A161XCT7_9HYPH|nr:FHA domain-containing protein [Pseudovibrio axinellae]KZL12568.1 FHA domain protein [Pseudovibrio axinellae]SEP66477.1 type VI secretion system protein [Pseudovibrio axinellae]